MEDKQPKALRLADELVPDELQLFESWIVRETGPGATKRWLNTDAYENMRVNDYRTGWVMCLELMRATSQPVGDVEVPMPEENILKIHALDSAEVRWIDREALRTYGDAREAAGYAAGVAVVLDIGGENQEKDISPSLETQMLLNEKDIENALRKSFHLGQIYWQQSDSEYTSQHRKSEETRQKFEHLVTDTLDLYKTCFILQGEV